MARVYSLKDRREMAINEDRRALLASGRRISSELRSAIVTGDGRKVFDAIVADARKPGAWFPGTVKAAVNQAHRTKTSEAFAALARDVRDVYVNTPAEDEVAP